MPPPKFYVSWPPGFTLQRAKESLNLVLVAEAFPAHREAAFLMLVESFTQTLFRTAPFHRLKSLFTVSAVFVESAVSIAHITDGKRCDWRTRFSPFGGYLPGQDDNVPFDTPFHVAYCRSRKFDNEPVPRGLFGDKTRVKAVLDQVPQLTDVRWDALVLVDNDQAYGGSGDGFGNYGARIGWLSLTGDWINVAIHEIGHSVFHLADEYQYDGPEVHSAVEPVGSNATIIALRDDLLSRWHQSSGDKYSLRIWHSLMSFDTPVPTEKDLSPGRVGLYEGADYSERKVFRPRLHCKMRHSSWEFCPICEWTIDAHFARLSTPLGLMSQSSVPGSWSHVLGFHEPIAGVEVTRYLFHNPSGAYAIHEEFDSAGLSPGSEISAPNSFTDAGWTTLVPFQFDGTPRILAHSLGRLAIYQIRDIAGMRYLFRTYDSGLAGFPFTHAAMFVSRGVPHVIGYNRIDGALEISSIETDSGPPLRVYGTADDNTRRWQRGFSHIVGMTVGGIPHVLKHDEVTGEVHVQSLDPPGLGPVTFVSRRGHWNVGATRVIAYELDHRTYVYRTAIGYYAALDWVWPNGDGVEMLYKENSFDTTLDAAYVEARRFGSGRYKHLVTIMPGWVGKTRVSLLRPL